MNNKELLPCPFCGGEADILQHKDGIDDWIVFCKKCGCQTDFMFTESEAISHWNSRVDVAKTEECCKKSCKEENATLEFLIPKWRTKQNGYYILEIPITQSDRIRFTITHTDGSSNFIYQLQLEISLWGHISYLVEECGQFNTLNEAKQKANKCIRELGERLVYFADNIRIEE